MRLSPLDFLLALSVPVMIRGLASRGVKVKRALPRILLDPESRRWNTWPP